MDDTGLIHNQAGALRLSGGGFLMGVGTVFGDVINDGGATAPGLSAGELTVDGDCTQGLNGTFDALAMPAGYEIVYHPTDVIIRTSLVSPDLNGDGFISLLDFGVFQACFRGAGAPPPASCNEEGVNTDLDADGDGDLDDCAILFAAVKAWSARSACGAKDRVRLASGRHTIRGRSGDRGKPGSLPRPKMPATSPIRGV